MINSCKSRTPPQRNVLAHTPLHTQRRMHDHVHGSETQLHTSKPKFRTFPCKQFQVLLTLFSKFFSSFPHGTCSLSVSCPYLALAEIYQPIRAAIPNNPTLQTRYIHTCTKQCTGFSPSLMLLSKRPMSRTLRQKHACNTTIPHQQKPARIPKMSFNLFIRHY